MYKWQNYCDPDYDENAWKDKPYVTKISYQRNGYRFEETLDAKGNIKKSIIPISKSI